MQGIASRFLQKYMLKELIENIYDAVEGCLSIDLEKIKIGKKDSVMELAV